MNIKQVLKVLIGNLCKLMRLPHNNVSSPALSIETWIRQLKKSNLPPLRGRIAILAGRNSTWVEFAVYAACWIRKLGYSPIIVFSGQEIKNIYKIPHALGLSSRIYHFLRKVIYTGSFWDKVLQIPDIILCDIDHEEKPDLLIMETYKKFAQEWAPTTAAYNVKVEEYEEGPMKQYYNEQVAKEEKNLIYWGALSEILFRRLSREYNIKRLLVYNGMIDKSPAVSEAARRLGWDIIFVETWGVKPGIMICNNAPAFEWDVYRWLKTMEAWDKNKSQEIDHFITFQETNKVTDVEWLKGFLQYQKSSVDDQINDRLKSFISDGQPIFLMAPNVIADSSTLRRRLIFDSQREWIHETCKFFKEHPEFKLIIRAHPAEYLVRGKVKIKIGDIAEEASAGAINIFVIKGDEDVSTYAFVQHVQAVLVWISNVGIDFVIRGCPVVSVARSYYYGLGIAHEPKSKEEYFSIISQLSQTKHTTTDVQKEIGKKYLSILYRERAFYAFGPKYGATDINLSGFSLDGDFEKFYRIIVGDLPVETRPTGRA